jgi:predicted nucleic acid-binding protein
VIFVDTNVFLRSFDGPGTPQETKWYEAAEALFEAAARGEEEVTTSEVVLHEVAYVLGSSKHYKLPATEIARYLRSIIQLPGLKLPRGDNRLYLRAIDIYSANPKLEFSDSIIAARAERLGASLATFDERLAKLDIVTRWQPPRLPKP